MNKEHHIEIQPVESLADQPLSTVIVTGLSPDEEVVLRASVQDEDGVAWMSWGVLRSDNSGSIDLSRQAPVSGTFRQKDPSAILWSMRPGGDLKKCVPMFVKTNVEPLSINVTVDINGNTVACKTIKRTYSSQKTGIIREPIDQNGVTGTLFRPDGEGPFPVVICLSGSGGGINEPRASLLASHGYAALALAYFNAGSLQKELSEIPVEFFERGLSWLKKHDFVDSERIGVYGYSKGGELALLLSSLYPQIKAVAAFSGSSYVWQGLRFGRPTSSWTRDGNILPYIAMKVPLKTMLKLVTGRAVAFRSSYERGLRAVDDRTPCAILVENINGSVFLVAGTDDQVWPAADFSDDVAARLKRFEHPHSCEYLREEGAGHLVCMPYVPSAEICRNLIFTSSDVALSSKTMIKAWNAMLDFFQRNLKKKDLLQDTDNDVSQSTEDVI